MSSPKITLGVDAREILLKLQSEMSEPDMKMLRLTTREVVALTLEEPEINDVLITHNGIPLLAVSESLMERIGENRRLEISNSENGEPTFKIMHQLQEV